MKVVGLIDSGQGHDVTKLLELWEPGTIDQLESFGFKAEGRAGWTK